MQALQPEKPPSMLDRCHAVRSAIESGNVQEAICIADEIAPDLMKVLQTPKTTDTVCLPFLCTYLKS